MVGWTIKNEWSCTPVHLSQGLLVLSFKKVGHACKGYENSSWRLSHCRVGWSLKHQKSLICAPDNKILPMHLLSTVMIVGQDRTPPKTFQEKGWSFLQASSLTWWCSKCENTMYIFRTCTACVTPKEVANLSPMWSVATSSPIMRQGILHNPL